MPFVTFNCECGSEIEFESQILPGQAGVVSCENCKVSWTIYCPTLTIKETVDLPEGLQKVWKELNK